MTGSRRIRGLHPYHFRSGEWAGLVGMARVRGRLCYHVRFPDGVEDFWVASDAADEYQIEEVPIGAPANAGMLDTMTSAEVAEVASWPCSCCGGEDAADWLRRLAAALKEAGR